jgi:hypothetical protein
VDPHLSLAKKEEVEREVRNTLESLATEVQDADALAKFLSYAPLRPWVTPCLSALVYSLICRMRHKYGVPPSERNLAVLEVLLNDADAKAGMDNRCLEEGLAVSHSLPLVQRLVRLAEEEPELGLSVTAKIVKCAEYLNRRPANIRTEEKTKVEEFIKAAFKRRNHAMALQRKKTQEEADGADPDAAAARATEEAARKAPEPRSSARAKRGAAAVAPAVDEADDAPAALAAAPSSSAAAAAAVAPASKGRAVRGSAKADTTTVESDGAAKRASKRAKKA